MEGGRTVLCARGRTLSSRLAHGLAGMPRSSAETNHLQAGNLRRDWKSHLPKPDQGGGGHPCAGGPFRGCGILPRRKPPAHHRSVSVWEVRFPNRAPRQERGWRAGGRPHAKSAKSAKSAKGWRERTIRPPKTRGATESRTSQSRTPGSGKPPCAGGPFRGCGILPRRKPPAPLRSVSVWEVRFPNRAPRQESGWRAGGRSTWNGMKTASRPLKGGREADVMPGGRMRRYSSRGRRGAGRAATRSARKAPADFGEGDSSHSQSIRTKPA